MSTIDIARRLASELLSLVDRRVKVVLVDGRVYDGVLHSFDASNMNILLVNVSDDKGNKIPKVFIRGERISEVLIPEIPLFDPADFREYVIREMKLPEHLVQVIPEAQAVLVQGRYKVTEKGVEGSGPIAEKLYQYFTKYVEERRKKLQGQ